MFWVAVVWGLGVTLGGSIGMMAFVVLFTGFKWMTQTEAVKKAERVSELSIAALTRRNQLTSEQIEQLNRIASAMEKQLDMYEGEGE